MTRPTSRTDARDELQIAATSFVAAVATVVAGSTAALAAASARRCGGDRLLAGIGLGDLEIRPVDALASKPLAVALAKLLLEGHDDTDLCVVVAAVGVVQETPLDLHVEWSTVFSVGDGDRGELSHNHILSGSSEVRCTPEEYSRGGLYHETVK